jgi:hypothetical protein
VDGLPADSVLDVHRIELALQDPDEPRRPEAVQLAKTGINRIEARVWFRNEDLEALAGAPTTLRVVLAASVLAHPRELQVAIGGSYTEIAPGGPVCRREPGIRGVRDTEPVDDLRCRTPLSSAWHIAKGEWNDPVWPGYSPFPRAFGVSRLYDLPQGRMPRSLPMLTLLVREPIGHFYREFEIPIDLEDFRL